MRLRPSAGGSRRVLRIGIVLAATLVAVAAVLGPANAAPSTKHYSATASPGSVAAGSTTTFTVTLTNSATSSQSFGSADIWLPAGFTAAGQPTTSLDGSGWTACFGDGTTCDAAPSNVVEVRSSSSAPSVAAGNSVTVRIPATAPCTTGSSSWQTTVKQSNNYNGPPGNDFVNSGGDPTETVTAGGAAAIDHFTIALPSSPFTATAGTSFTPTIEAVDTCGNPTTFSGNLGTLSGNLDSSPNGTAPGYPSPLLSFTNGVATPSVTGYDAESGRTLTFDPGFPYSSVTSSQFTVAPAAPSSLAFTQQPLVGGSSNWTLNTNGQSTGTPTTFGTQVTISDAYGNVATQVHSGSVTLKLDQPADSSSGGGGALNTTSTTPTAGVATFTGLTVSKSGIGYSLTASYGNGVGTATSDLFNIYVSIATCAANTCTQSQVATDGNTVVQATATGGFQFFAVGSFNSSGLSSHLGCQYFNSVYAKAGGGGIFESDVQTGVIGSQTYVYSVPMKLIQAKYGKNVGQQVIPICAGAQRVQVDKTTGNVVPIPCTQNVNGGWLSEQLDPTGAETGTLVPAVCDPSDGLYWGILPSFQDKGVPAGQPIVQSWSSGNIGGTNYRSFVVSVPAGWDYKMGG